MDKFEELRKGLELIKSISVRLFEKPGWSDDSFKTTYFEPSKRRQMTLSELKPFLLSYSQFIYAKSWDIPSMRDVIMALVYHAPKPNRDEFLFTQIFSQNQPDFSEHIELIKQNCVKSIENGEKNKKSFIAATSTGSAKTTMSIHGWSTLEIETETESFYAPLELLYLWIDKCKRDDDIWNLLRYFSFHALVSLRLAAKSTESVLFYYKRKFHVEVQKLYPTIPFHHFIPPPSEEYLELSKRMVSNGSTLGSSSYSAMIGSLLCETDPFVEKLLMSTFLSETKGNGMGLMVLTEKAAIHCKTSLKEIITSCMNENSLPSQRLKMHIENYYSKPTEKSWWWARILSNGYFADLSTKNNDTTCLTLAGILYDKNPGIFNIKPLSLLSDSLIDKAKNNGAILRIIFQNRPPMELLPNGEY